MAVEELVSQLQLEIGQFRSQFNQAQRIATANSQRMEQSIGRLDSSFQSVSRTVGIFRSALAATGVALFVREAVQASNQIVSLNNAFRTITGSAKGAQDTLKFLREESNRLGLSFVDSAKSFQSLAAAARGTSLEGEGARKVFVAVAQASRVLGLSSDQTSGALTALQQIMSKGTVQAEELRGQLGERIPGAFQIAARAVGVTTEELGKMLEQGQLLAEDFLPRFANQLDKEFAGGVSRAASTFQAETGRMGNAIRDLLVEIGNLITQNPEVATAIREATESFNILARAIRDASGPLGQIVGFFAQLASGIIRTAVEEIQFAAEALKASSQESKTLSERLQAIAELLNRFIPLGELFTPQPVGETAEELRKFNLQFKETQQGLFALTELEDALSMPSLVASLEEVEAKLAQLRKKFGDSAEEQAKQIIAEIKAEEQARKEAAKLEEEHAEESLRLIRERVRAQERANDERLQNERDTMDRFLAIQRRGWAEIERIEQESIAKRAREERRALEARQREYERFADQIEDKLSVVFKDALQGNIKNSAEFLKETFFTVLAQIAARAATTQLILPAIVSLTGGSTGQIGGLLGGVGTTGTIPSGSTGLLGGILNTPLFSFGGTGTGGQANNLGVQAVPGGASNAGTSPATGATSASVGSAIGGIGTGIGVGTTISQLFAQTGAGGTLGADLTSGVLGGAAGGFITAGPFGAAAGAGIGFLATLIKNIIEEGAGPTLGKVGRTAPFPGSLATLPLTGGFGSGAGNIALNLLGIGGALDLFKQGPKGRLSVLTSAGTAGFEGGRFTQTPFGNVGLSDRFTHDTTAGFDRDIQAFIVQLDQSVANLLDDRQTKLAAAFLQRQQTGPKLSFREFDNEAAVLVASRLQSILRGIAPDALQPLVNDVFKGVKLTEENLPQLTAAFQQMVAVFNQFEPLAEQFDSINIDGALRAGKSIEEIIDSLTRLGQTFDSIDAQITALTEAMQTPAEIFEKRLDQIAALQGQLIGAGIDEALQIAAQIQQFVGQAFQLAPQADVFGQDETRQRQAQTDLIDVLRGLQSTLSNIPSFQGITSPVTFGRPTLAAVHEGETLYPSGRSGDTYNITVNSASGDPTQIARDIRRELESYSRFGQTTLVSKRRGL